jgi:hypothetical protein
MTAPVHPGPDLVFLDELLVQALAELRAARVRGSGGSNWESLLNREEAESNLNALLDYRFAAARRRRPEM